MEAIITKRHNQALCKLYKCIAQHSPLNRCYTILDATDKNSLPHGVASNRIAKWILPRIDDATRERLRPDLMIFEHIDSAFLTGIDPSLPLPDDQLSLFKQLAIIHIVELSYTSTHSLSESRKLRQHTLLVHLLVEEGWRISTAITAYRTLSPPPAPTLPQPAEPCTVHQRPRDLAPSPPPKRAKCSTLFYETVLNQHDPIHFPPLPDGFPDPKAYTYIDPSLPLAKRPTPPSPPINHLHAAKCPRNSSHPSPSSSIEPPDPYSHLSNRVHILLLGTEGYLYRPIDLIFSSTLQIPLAPANCLLAKLHKHAIYYLHTLVRHRRALDFSPSDASLPPPHHSHDPP